MSDPSSNDRLALCVFTFDDGRHCAMPRAHNALNLCYFHEQRERRRLDAKNVGEHIPQVLNADVQTACNLHAAFTLLFRGAALGHIPAADLGQYTRLGRLLLDSHLLAKEEILSTYEPTWPEIVERCAALSRPQSPTTADSAPNSEPDNLDGQNTPNPAIPH